MSSMPKAAIVRDPQRLFAPAEVDVTRRADGCILLRSPQSLRPYPRAIGEYLLKWAGAAADRPFLCQRGPDGSWLRLTYGEALREVLRLGGWLLSLGSSPERPVAILSENSIRHGLLALAAMHVGVPCMPISPAYSLMSQDFAKLISIIRCTHPAVIYVEDSGRFAAALRAIEPLHRAILLTGDFDPAPSLGAQRFGDVRSSQSQEAVEQAFARVTSDTIAKILFTSGSTDEPKGVLNTQRMLSSNQQALVQIWPALESAASPPVVVDWLPWNHTFGGNFTFNFVLRHGGTLYIDGGRPMPALFGQTLANLREIAPTVVYNVPRAFDLLVTALADDTQLRRHFFSRLQVMFYGAASLPRNIWDALTDLARRTTGERIPLLAGWGSTETAPLATFCHFQAEAPGVIGLPVPGCELKLVPAGGKLEVRVRGANVTPGYLGRPDLNRKSFDEEGFYRIGDALRFADPAAPERGVCFDGRICEDFKLTSGTWVSTGDLRVRGIAVHSPIVQDIVVTGHDREDVGFLIFPNIAACRALCADTTADLPVEKLLAHPLVRAHVLSGLREMKRATPASSAHAARAVLLAEPPSVDAGEITDKGYINQRAVLSRRSGIVDLLYRADDPAVITP
ncbi:MAG TPA: feruloyl-CoA synthase [Steroidobacteraceae bacterium]|nr:feruloyl-CoA synthase [Steroidobacteraceae bacterium]